ncbi:cytochrome P450 [Spirillospora sp. NPDC048911]|uniref:cytochrome P450 n=1 Tax=Spirillospora sp. NPDC048911 TaxID=3364527 RepID=UPI00371C8F50
MSATVKTNGIRKPRNFPLYKTLPGFIRNPLKEIEHIGRVADGDLARLDLGASKPLIATHPDHVQKVLRNSGDYVRAGTFWRPLHGLMGDGILGEGELWALSRRSLQPLFTTRNVNTLVGRMAETIDEAVGELDGPARDRRPVSASAAMIRIVNRTVLRVFFGEKVSPAEIERLGPAFEAVATKLVFRFLLPFVPEAVPMPGDRAYRRGVQIMDEVMYGLVERYRDDPGPGEDIFTALCRARTEQGHTEQGHEVSGRWIRDNLVAMFATSTETTSTALTWLWPTLESHPDVARRLYDEIEQVTQGKSVTAEHLPQLAYTRQVVQELLRLYPVGWLFPRVARRPDSIGGVPIKAGQSVLISPYLTHRLPSVWDRPLVFDPDRFAPGRGADRHRYAYFPFGGGQHQCIGMHVFNLEAQLVIASILSRYRPELRGFTAPAAPRIGATIRPSQDPKLILHPLDRVR